MASNLIRNMLISASLLGFFGALGTSMVLGIHQVTKEKIDANIKASLLKSLNTIIPSQTYNNDLLQSTIQVPASSLLGNDIPTTVYQAKMEGKPAAVAFDITAPDGYSGDINILIAIRADGNISGVRVISHKETPGLGDKIEATRSDWITKFSGKSLQSPKEKHWKVKKDGGVFDQFTGATITPRAIVKAVHNALSYFQNNRRLLFLDQKAYDQLNPPTYAQQEN